jgi:hypothetical protein
MGPLISPTWEPREDAGRRRGKQELEGDRICYLYTV